MRMRFLVIYNNIVNSFYYQILKLNGKMNIIRPRKYRLLLMPSEDIYYNRVVFWGGTFLFRDLNSGGRVFADFR